VAVFDGRGSGAVITLPEQDALHLAGSLAQWLAGEK